MRLQARLSGLSEAYICGQDVDWCFACRYRRAVPCKLSGHIHVRAVLRIYNTIIMVVAVLMQDRCPAYLLTTNWISW